MVIYRLNQRDLREKRDIMSYFFTTVMSLIFTYSVPVFNLISIILGIIIIVRKDVLTKLLGIWLITWSVSNILANALRMFSRIFNMETFAKFSSVSSIARTVLGAAGLICLFLFAKFSYKAKGLIAIIIIRLAEAPAVLAYNAYWTTSSDRTELTSLRFSYSLTILRELIALIIFVIIFLAYFKNRRSEERLPKMWLVPFFYILSSVAMTGYCIYTVIMSNSISYLEINSGIYELTGLLINNAPMYITPVAAIYILVNGRKLFERKKKVS